MIEKKTVNDPLSFPPIFKEKIWGGQLLKTKLFKNIPENKEIGESWELSGFGDDISCFLADDGKKISLQDLIYDNPRSLLGSACNSENFPLLFKFIDAQDKLSIQVHPDDFQAKENNWGILGKTECWYIVDAKPDAQIIVGFKPNVSIDDIDKGIRNNSLESILNFIPIQKGDVLFIPAGTVHAILDGTLIYEVQQASDTTFRMYDWGRLDNNGKSRDLHIKESLAVVNTSFHNNHIIEPLRISKKNGVSHWYRVVCDYFVLEEFCFENDGQVDLPYKQSFMVITILSGNITLKLIDQVPVEYSTGQTVLLPDDYCNQLGIIQGSAETRILISSVPDIKNEIIEFLIGNGVSIERLNRLGGNEGLGA